MEILKKQNIRIHPDKMIKQRLAELCKEVSLTAVNDFTETFLVNCSLRYYLKNEVIGIETRHPNEYLYIIHSGIAHTFVTDPQTGKSITTHIWKKEDIIFDLKAYISGSKTAGTTSMLDDGYIISISYKSLRSLFARHPQMFLILSAIQYLLIARLNQHNYLNRLSANERVKSFLDDHPTMVHRVNKEVIANFLGISRSRFSKAFALYKINMTRSSENSDVGELNNAQERSQVLNSSKH
jgi:CRP-like cAMP-binding protein